MEDIIIEGKGIYLRQVALEDADRNYCGWMNDPEITRYTESRFSAYTLEDIKAYIEKESQSKDSLFLAIVLKSDKRHIGNIKIHRIDKAHRHAEISLLIGEKSCWGRGIGTEAIRLAAEYAFKALNLHKVYAGCYANNIGSIRAFKKSGFKEEAIMKEHYLFEGQYIDGVQLGILNQLEG